MTPNERLMAYQSGETVDRIPYTISLNETAASYFGYSSRDYLFSSDVMVDVEHKIVDTFGGDGISYSVNTRMFAEAAGSEMLYTDRGYSTIHKYLLEEKNVFPEIREMDPHRDGRLAILLEAVKKTQERSAQVLPVSFSVPCPANCALGIISLENFLRTMIRNREMFTELMEYCLNSVLEIVRVYHKETGLTPSVFDVTAAKQVMSCKQYEKYIFPYTKRLVDGIESITGKRPSFGACGSNAHIWDLLKTLGFTAFSVDCTDSISEAKEKLGIRYPISGNLDGTSFLICDQEEINQMVRQVLWEASDSQNGFTLAIGGGPIAFGTPREKVEYLRDAIHHFGKDAQKGKKCSAFINRD